MAELVLSRKTGTAKYYVEKLDGVGLEMTLIPAGEFWMGTPDEEIERLCKEYGDDYFRWESPQHRVQVPKFFMGKYPVTQEQWKIVAGWEPVNQDLEPNPSKFQKDFDTHESHRSHSPSR